MSLPPDPSRPTPGGGARPGAPERPWATDGQGRPLPRPARAYQRRYDTGPNRSGPVVDDRPKPQRPPKKAGFFRRLRNTLRDPEVPLWKRALLLMTVLGGFALLPVLAVGAYALYLLPTTPDGTAIDRAAVVHPTIVYAANGERLTQFEAPFREWVPLDSIPVHVVRALVATEDRRFYEHQGIDLRRSVSAVWHTASGDTQGGSTLTQQLARNLFPASIGTSITAERKLREMIAALRIERAHSKREILEAYLNTAPFLYNAVGLEMAARTYFGTTAHRLTVEQGATLVGMLKGPAYYNPLRHPDRARERRDLVLGLMAQQGALTPGERDSLQALPLDVHFQRQPEHESDAPHFTAAVRRFVEEWAETYGYDVTRDGLVVWTTLDPGLQREAEAVVDVEWSQRGMPSMNGLDSYVRRAESVSPFAYFWAANPEVFDAHARRSDEYRALREEGNSEEEALERLRGDDTFADSLRASVTRLETGLVAVNPHTGDVRAYVGSRNFDRDQYDHAGVARRQPGSTFKAFVYATALQSGYGPEDRVRDEAVAVDMGNGRMWRPTNSGSVSGAEMTLADALAYSKNTVTVQLANSVGIARVAVTARRMGIRSRLDVVPSLALGTSPVTVLEMAGAYGTLANEGRHVEPRMVTRIETMDGRVLERFEPRDTYAMPGRDARTLTAMLRGAVERGTGRGLSAFGLRGQYAGKTGTTQRSADGWFIGMHPDLVAASWVGFNDQRLRFRSTYWGQGGHNALLVVGDFFRRANLPAAAFPAPPEPLPPYPGANSDSLDLDEYFTGYEYDYEQMESDGYGYGYEGIEGEPEPEPAYDALGYSGDGTLTEPKPTSGQGQAQGTAPPSTIPRPPPASTGPPGSTLPPTNPLPAPAPLPPPGDPPAPPRGPATVSEEGGE